MHISTVQPLFQPLRSARNENRPFYLSGDEIEGRRDTVIEKEERVRLEITRETIGKGKTEREDGRGGTALGQVWRFTYENANMQSLDSKIKKPRSIIVINVHRSHPPLLPSVFYICSGMPSRHPSQPRLLPLPCPSFSSKLQRNWSHPQHFSPVAPSKRKYSSNHTPTSCIPTQLLRQHRRFAQILRGRGRC